MNSRLSNLTARATLVSVALLAIAGFGQDKATLTGSVSASQQVSFEIYIPVQNRAQLEQDLASLHDSNSPKYHQWLKPSDFNARYAASSDQLSAIQSQLAGYGLTANIITPHRIRVSGPASAVEQAFGTKLQKGKHSNGSTVVVATQPIAKTGALAKVNAVVAGLSGVIRMRPHSQRTPQNRYGPYGGYWFDDLKQAYGFPSYLYYTGKGATIGILMSGDYNPPDMDLYFGHENLPTPHFSTVNVDGGAPFDPNGDSFETHLDLQQAGGMAPDANIILYNLPDLSEQAVLDGLSQILAENKVDVVSMSFGAPELFYTAAYNDGEDFTYLLQQEDDLFAQGTAQGITFVASSGDLGALYAPSIKCFSKNPGPSCVMVASVSEPASSPHVVGVGGTNLTTAYTLGSRDSSYVSENAYANPSGIDFWYGTSATGEYWGSGGGDSIVFKKPPYQFLVNTGNKKFRTVPDVSGHMGGCPLAPTVTCNVDANGNITDSYVLEAIGGNLYGVLGTSASAPAFAGLTALAVQRFGHRLGNLNYYIYTLAAAQNAGLLKKVFNTGIPGFNGLYHTTPTGYNRVLGNGTVNGRNFLLAPFVPTAGIPQTPSNP